MEQKRSTHKKRVHNWTDRLKWVVASVREHQRAVCLFFISFFRIGLPLLLLRPVRLFLPLKIAHWAFRLQETGWSVRVCVDLPYTDDLDLSMCAACAREPLACTYSTVSVWMCPLVECSPDCWAVWQRVLWNQSRTYQYMCDGRCSTEHQKCSIYGQTWMILFSFLPILLDWFVLCLCIWHTAHTHTHSLIQTRCQKNIMAFSMFSCSTIDYFTPNLRHRYSRRWPVYPTGHFQMAISSSHRCRRHTVCQWIWQGFGYPEPNSPQSNDNDNGRRNRFFWVLEAAAPSPTEG